MQVFKLLSENCSSDILLVVNDTDCGTILADALVERRGDVCIFAAVEENLLNFSIKDHRHQKLGFLGALLWIVQRLVVIQPVGPRVVEEDGIRPRSKY